MTVTMRISTLSLLVATSLLLSATNPSVLAQSVTTTAVTATPEPTVDPDLLQCSASGVAIATGPCFQQLGNVYGNQLNTAEAVLDNAPNVLRTLCSDTCNVSYRNSMNTLANSCGNSLSGLFTGKVGCHAPPVDKVDAVKNIARDTMIFGKDLLCLKDSKVDGDAKFCSYQWVQLIKKYQLVTMDSLIHSNLTVTPNKDINQLMSSLGKTYNSFGHLVVPRFNLEAWKNVPEKEVCTPCAKMEVSQSFTFSMQKLYPVLSQIDSNVAENLKKRIDEAIKSINGRCGQGFVSCTDELVLGTVNAQSDMNQKSGAPSTMTSQFGVVIASVLALMFLIFA